MKNGVEISRRKLLGTAGALGAASAIGGAGTLAFFSDEEEFANNGIEAGTLDMKVGYSAHYSDWKPDEAGTPEDENVDVRMWEGPPATTGSLGDLEDGEVGLPTNDAWQIAVSANDETPDVDGDEDVDGDDAALQFLDNTQYRAAGTASCGVEGTDADDVEQPVINLEDVKPGDFGEVTFDFALCDNPGYVWLQGELLSCAENGTTEPEEDDPDESSLWPLLSAGAVPSASSLFDSDKRQKAVETVEKAVESDTITRQDLLKTAATGTAGALGAGAMAGSAAGAPGDLLGEVELPGHSSGVGIAFDGTYTYVVGGGGLGGSILQVYEPPAGGDGTATQVAEKSIVDGDGNSVSIDSLDWDRGRGQFWAIGGDQMLLMDVGDPTDGNQDAVVSEEFSTGLGNQLWDGIAYDGETDTIWLSPDVSSEVYHFESDGTQLDTVDPTDLDGSDATRISGIAIGSDVDGRPTLFLGRNGQSRITRHYADDGTAIEQFAELPFRVEDLACDPVTYDSDAILTKDAFDGFYVAFEVESGTCLLGGEEPEPGGECADVELLDVVRAAAWIDDGDNYQDGDEAPAVVGSLREVLDQLSSGTGFELDGDIDAATGGGTGERGCFSASTTHSVSFAWWVPVDHGNEIQTDSVAFDLGFYTEQCRHNDGSGQPTETPGGG